jgi:pilus assembly protein CpaF
MTTQPHPTILDPLNPIFEDPQVTEVMIDAPNRVLFEKRGEIVDAGIDFGSFEQLRAVIDAVLAMAGAAFKPGQTVCDTRLTDGSRILAVLPPSSINSPTLVIRKFIDNQMTFEKLLEYRAITPEAIELLTSAIRANRNLVVGGGTGSGKTTVLNVLTGVIPETERVITVEPVMELSVRAPRLVRLCADLSPDQSYLDLILTAAKMRPDRLIFGELRGGEVLHILNLVNSGYDGAMMTIHAASPEDSLARMEAMCLMANVGLGLSEIRHLIASAIHLITQQRRMPNGARRITHITELCGFEEARYLLQPLFRYNEATDTLEATGAKASWS